MPDNEQQTHRRKLICDFTTGAVRHRMKFGGGRGQALAKAVGMKSGINPNVVDATAGLGSDAFLLASLGAKVTLIERSRHMHDLLKVGMEKAKYHSEEFSKIINRMTLIFGDAKVVLDDLSPEVVVIDPMHPPRNKSALVKQEMRLIRDIVGNDDDKDELFEVALKTAKNRVVLKWPRLAPDINNQHQPSHQIMGKSTRYDVFMQN